MVGCTPGGSGGKKDTALEPLPPEITWQSSPDPIERAPIALTTSDGAGLELVSLQVRTVIEEPLAFTELHMRFSNPEDRRREGRFEIALPQEAAISRFAMRIGSELREGEVVERKRAQQVYEDFLHRRQDPALLEKDAGNEFAARVFPIDPHEEKEIILSYSEELSSRADPYRVRLEGLPQLRSFSADIRVGSDASQHLTLSKEGYAPTGDLEVRLPKQKPIALRNGELVVARVVPVLSLPTAKVDGLTVLFDTSASRALGFGAQIERSAALLKELQARAGSDFDVRVVAFDQDSEEIYSGPASGFGLREQGKLLTRGALGASSLEQALAFVARDASTHGRVLVVSDGVVTAGARDTTGLREAIAKLAAHGARRLDVLAEGGIQDLDTLRALTRSGLRDAGTVLDARQPIAQLADRMLLGVADQVEVHIAGATWVYPSVLANVQAGDERLVFAQLPSGVPVQIELLGAGAEAFDTRDAPRPLLERAWTRAKIASLTDELSALRPEQSAQRAQKEAAIVELSVAQRVLSDFTALLVLESEYDYQRYHIARDGLSDILTVGDEGIELYERGGSNVLQIAKDKGRDDRPTDMEQARADTRRSLNEGAAPEEDEARPVPEDKIAAAPAPASDGLGSLGRSGTGIGGSGRGEGRAERGVAEGAPARESSGVALRSRSSAGSSKGEQPMASKPAAAAAAEPMPPAPAPASPPAKTAANSPGADSERSELRVATSGTGELDAARSGAVVPAAALEAAARVYGGQTEGLPADEARAALRGVTGRARQCYARSTAPAPLGASERLSFELSISDKGVVSDAFIASGSLADRSAQNCILAALRQVRFPKPSGARASIAGSVELSMVRGTAPVNNPSLAIAAAPRKPRAVKIPTPAIDDAYEGVLADVLRALERKDVAHALETANNAVAANPGDVIALIALGEALEAQNDRTRAARAYGSLIDLFPSRADMRRMAGERLERLSDASAWLAVDSYARALEQRPDHPSSHRLLAYAQLKNNQPERAFETLERALERSYRADRFEGAERILREDLGLVGAAWLRADPSKQERIATGLAAHGAELENKPSLRFVLTWETDANDVDFHIYDGRGGHAFYQRPKLASGGALYADITSGYGPECFAIPGAKRAYPYTLQAHYFARGPMGFGMGKLQVVDHTGDGNLLFEEFPFVIMKDKAFVQLARTRGVVEDGQAMIRETLGSVNALQVPSGQHQ